MECQRGLATRKLSLRPSVCPSLCQTCDFDKTEESSVQFFYIIQKIIWPNFACERKNGWWGRDLLPEILGQTDPVGEKTPTNSRYSLVAPQR